MVSLPIWCAAASRFVQVMVEPAGTVTDAGMKAKFWMVMAAETGAAVVWTVVVIGGGVVTVVATGVAPVAGGGVAGAVVTGVVVGACP